MAFLVDSNIIIYSLSDKYRYLRELLIDSSCHISEISRVEVLGYHRLEKSDKNAHICIVSAPFDDLLCERRRKLL